MPQGFCFDKDTQRVRRLSDAVDVGNSLLDGFGEPSYEQPKLKDRKASIRMSWRLGNESPLADNNVPFHSPTNGFSLMDNYTHYLHNLCGYQC